MNRIILGLFLFLTFQLPIKALEYDFSNPDSVKIPLRINETITTALRNKSYEGQKLSFAVDKDVYYNNQLLVKKGDIATARLAYMTTRGFAGIGAEIFMTDFKIGDLDSDKIIEPVSKRGVSATALILPIKWALTPLPPFGTLTNIMLGFNAKLTPKKVLYVEYFPDYVL